MAKKDILNSLKISREEREPQGAGVGQKYGVIWWVVLFFCAGAMALYFLRSDEVMPPDVDTTNIAASVDRGGAGTERDAKNLAARESTSANSSVSLNASGYVTARRQATVSAQVLGRVVSVDVEEGMRVDAGQVLASLDDAVAKMDLQISHARVAAQTARLSGLKTELSEQTRVLQRLLSLGKKDLASEAQMTRAKADTDKLANDVKALEADIRVAKIQVKRQKTVLDYYTVRAPFSGVITTKNAQPGEILAPSSAGGGFTRTGICTIVDMSSLEIEVDVNESFIGRVFQGQSVTANLDAYPDWDVRAEVIAVIPAADRAKATVSVRIRILDQDARILPDMGVKVAFYHGSTKSLSTSRD